jgi:hypothetical protein
MSPTTSLHRVSPVRTSTWDPQNGVFMPAERRPKRIDRTALCVQITLCIVVAALLFSVIGLPKLRDNSSTSDTLRTPPAPAAVR